MAVKKKPGVLSSPFLCGWTADYSAQPIVYCGVAATHAFASTANSATYYACATHLAVEQQRVPAFITSVTALPLLPPDVKA